MIDEGDYMNEEMRPATWKGLLSDHLHVDFVVSASELVQ